MKHNNFLFFILILLVCSCSVRMNEDVIPEPLTLRPTEVTIKTKPAGVFFYTKGGYPPYEYSILQGYGVIENGFFAASQSPGISIIQVKDKRGNTATSRVIVKSKKN